MTIPSIKYGIVIEDIPETREWLGRLLLDVFPGITLGYAANCQEGTELMRAGNPDIALIDLGLPDGSGIDIIRNTREEKPDCCIVVSTVFEDDHHLFGSLQAGANGYILKDQSPAEIEQLLQGILQGMPPLSPAIARKVLAFFHTVSAIKTEKPSPLTPKETEILLLIAKGYTVAKTAELSGIAYNTAASHVKNIYRKLNISSRAEAALEAGQLGIL